MYEKLKGVVLRTTKYNEKNAIVKVYTDERGLLSFLLPQNNGKAARVRRAIFQPLTIVEMEAEIPSGRDIFRIRESRCADSLVYLRTDPIKNAIALFLTEILSHIIVEREQNHPLFAYIATSIRLLNEIERGASNFHICFLYHLGAFIGIEPDTSTYRSERYFDMEEGIFVDHPPLHRHYIDRAESPALMRISRMTFENMHFFRFSRTQRKRLIELIIEYYRLHNAALGEIRSLDILAELWD